MLTVFALSWATSRLGFTRDSFLLIQLFGSGSFALAILAGASIPERGRRCMLIGANAAMIVFALVWPRLLAAGTLPASLATCIGMWIVGLVFGPLGTELTELFPVNLRYSGTSLAFSGTGIVGASLAPYAATFLATRFGLQSVGYYMAAAAAVSMWAIAARRTASSGVC